MEIMSSKLPHSFNMNNEKRKSCLKPPIPPKPKIIPKPKFFANVNDINSKVRPLLNVHNVSDTLSSVSSNSDRFSIASDKRDMTKMKPCEKLELKYMCNVKMQETVCQKKSEFFESIQNEINKNLFGQSFVTNSSEDISSCLMERTLEDCATLSSKSSSNTSIGLDDSDSDEYMCSKDNNLNAPNSLSYPSCPKITISDSSDVTNLREFGNKTDEDNDDTFIEDNRKRKAYLVAKEMKTSEQSFVATLKLLNEKFKSFLIEKGCVNTKAMYLEKTYKTDSISEKDLEEILKFLPNLQNLNEEILCDFEIRIKHWRNNSKIADIIIRKGPFLKLYANYIRELEYHTNLLKDCADRFTYFGECLKEFETSNQCHFIPISKHMLTPMQRITKYKDIMKQYLKYLDPDSADYEDATEALEIVKGVAEHANEAIRDLENSARLLNLQERLNGVSPPDLSAGSSALSLQNLLVQPGVKLLKEGQLLKLCRRGVRVVYLILLSDSLLYTLQDMSGGRNCVLKLRYCLKLEGMRLDIPVSEDFQTEFTVISTSRSFTVRASSTAERDTWISTLRNAIESNARRRFSFEKAKSTEYEALAANVLGEQAPAWIPDNRVTMCQLCTSEFSMTFRRHHCRACGKVVCRYCSSNRAPLAYLSRSTERVCDKCYEELQKAGGEDLGKQEERIEDEEEKKMFKRSGKTIKGIFKRGVKDQTRKSRFKKPERLLEVCGGDHSSQICGYLRHFKNRAWRLSWFVLKDKVLYEYRAPEDVCALNSVPILGYTVNTDFESLDIFDGLDATNAFQLSHSNQQLHANQSAQTNQSHASNQLTYNIQHSLIFYGESQDLALKWKSVMEKEVLL